MSDSNSPINSVAILGCGLIGLSWAETFLAAGYRVNCWDPDNSVEAELNSLKKRYPDDTLIFHATAEEAVSSADFIQESGPESLPVKQLLYKNIAENIQAHAVLASSTSTLKATELQKECSFADRVVVGHPFNPPHILPLVEVVGGEQTSEETIKTTLSFYRQLGKQAIRLNTERSGHLANRIQAAVWREAIDAVASGQAGVEDVDTAMLSALGPRWAVMGPFETFELGGGKGGLKHFLDHLGGVFEDLWDDAQRPVMTEELKTKLVEETSALTAGKTNEMLVERRDRQLRALLQSGDQEC